VGALRELPGRTSIVLFSDGFTLVGDNSRPRAHITKDLRALHGLIDRPTVQARYLT